MSVCSFFAGADRIRCDRDEFQSGKIKLFSCKVLVLVHLLITNKTRALKEKKTKNTVHFF